MHAPQAGKEKASSKGKEPAADAAAAPQNPAGMCVCVRCTRIVLIDVCVCIYVSNSGYIVISVIAFCLNTFPL